MAHFELYTRRGEMLAAHLLSSLGERIAAGSVTYAAALGELCASVADIASVDRGMNDSEPHWAIAAAASRSFEKAGWKPLNGEELHDLAYAWKRNDGKGRPEADGNRHFADTSWYDAEELAFFEACEAVDEVKGALNNVNYYARTPEFAPCPRVAVAAPGPDPVKAPAVRVREGVLSFAVPADVSEKAAPHFAALSAAVDAANVAVSSLSGRLSISTAVIQDLVGPQFVATYGGRVFPVSQPVYEAVPAARAIAGSLDELRAAALEAASSDFDFGSAVEAMSGWEWETPGDEYTRRVFVTDVDHPDEDLVKGALVVRFEPGSAAVAEVYAVVGGQVVESKPAAAPAP